jgi:hypothetical protein
MMRSRSVNRTIFATKPRKVAMQPTFPSSSDDQRYRFMIDDASDPATPPPAAPHEVTAIAPLRVCLPDLNDAAGNVAGDIVISNGDAAFPLGAHLVASDEDIDRSAELPVMAEVVEPNYVEPNYYDRMRRSMRELPSYVANFASDRGRLTSIVASGAILSTAAVLLIIVLQGDGSSSSPVSDDAPPQWTQVAPKAEWSQDVFAEPSSNADAPNANAHVSSDVLGKEATGDSTAIDAVRLTSPWPRQSGVVGPLLAGGETSETTRSAGRPNVAENVSSANEPARVARLSGTIEPMTDTKHRR